MHLSSWSDIVLSLIVLALKLGCLPCLNSELAPSTTSQPTVFDFLQRESASVAANNNEVKGILTSTFFSVQTLLVQYLINLSLSTVDVRFSSLHYGRFETF